MQVHTFARGAVVIAMVLSAAPARAQSEEGAGTIRLRESPSRLHFLLGAETVLHAVDMITTAHNLHLGGSNVREANPLLAPLSGRPVALVAVSSAINVLQVYTVAKVRQRHPKVALAWALILLGTEAYVVTNNLRIAGQLQRPPAAGTR